jgi:hypothetical protein
MEQFNICYFIHFRKVCVSSESWKRRFTNVKPKCEPRERYALSIHPYNKIPAVARASLSSVTPKSHCMPSLLSVLDVRDAFMQMIYSCRLLQYLICGRGVCRYSITGDWYIAHST